MDAKRTDVLHCYLLQQRDALLPGHGKSLQHAIGANEYEPPEYKIHLYAQRPAHGAVHRKPDQHMFRYRKFYRPVFSKCNFLALEFWRRGNFYKIPKPGSY